MANTRAVLVHPTTRADGSPFPIAELKHVLLETKAQAATTWTQVGGPMLPAETSRTVQNVTGGVWDYRATWVDTQDRSSVPAGATISVPISQPNAGTLTVTIV
jgi:hypothetical protein